MTRSVSVTTAVRLRAPMIKSPSQWPGRYGLPRLGDGQRWVGCHRVGCVLPVHSGSVADLRPVLETLTVTDTLSVLS